MKKYRFISDPGHGWLEVPLAEVVEMGIAVTPYSYRHHDLAYLEEDCDAPKFLKSLALRDAMRGEKSEIVEVYQENTPIRRYQSY